ncbi:uracil-DNA glycosylase [Vibrio sp. UCD-FRSSP16_10]|uniref:uracil-DNA glycosylase n=1 Tax=unclassified Vibrio TaxID=2614977 RepID=UPI0007FDE385|nr:MULTISPECIES: uracil-DNA glycosylase [unclassified Vibrio]OBT07315.1 uracil-DNA glycosylase [Vibrio sp. UCD-FRSSP16_30]OBT12794.1 uracil-DNA glycosylase [Vibrio sp. UCD-FRSSP16_10]
MSWQDFIEAERSQDYFRSLQAFVDAERLSGKTIYPDPEHVFSAFTQTPIETVKVVILGQDPYHGPNQAHGLSFSVLPGNKIPPSLRNIYKELTQDITGFAVPEHGYLQAWAEQGVLLLNTVLTVEQGQAHSHAKSGWEIFTQRAIEYLTSQQQNIVFMLWGAHAQKKGACINPVHHCILTSPHPSPLSARRGFFGCQHFSKANVYLKQHGKSPINWQVPSANLTLF